MAECTSNDPWRLSGGDGSITATAKTSIEVRIAPMVLPFSGKEHRPQKLHKWQMPMVNFFEKAESSGNRALTISRHHPCGRQRQVSVNHPQVNWR
jgi:hypothetical protein